MSDFDTLLAQIQSSIDLANSLSQNPDDNAANCAAALTAARDALVASVDKSADCVCPCHTTNPNWHEQPCGCYTGNPLLE